MRKILRALVAFGFLYAAPIAWAAFASVGTIGTATSTSAGTTLVLTPTNTCNAGNFCTLNIALDNTCTSDGNTTEVSGVVDSVGNSYLFFREFCHGTAGAGNGAAVSNWGVIPTTNLTSSDTVTITFANTITSKAANMWEFTIGAGNTVTVAGNAADSGLDASDPASMAISGLSSQEYLFVRSIALEGNSGNFTVTGSYTAFTLALANTGTASTSIFTRGEFRILTGTGDTSDPATSVDLDHASIYLALKETPPAAVNFFPRRIQRGGP